MFKLYCRIMPLDNYRLHADRRAKFAELRAPAEVLNREDRLLTTALVAYAAEQIEALKLGDDGPLGTEFVVAYDDAGSGKVRISDGHGTEVCDSPESVDAALQAWVDWIEEDA